MYEYIIGKISKIEPTYIVLENNNIGYLIIVANPYLYSLNEEIKVYVYLQVKEDANNLYGFRQKEEKDLFLKLISVTGIGPKTALSILASNQFKEVTDAIETGNAKFLMKFPGIGQKASQQIILDLKGKLIDEKSLITEELSMKSDLIAALTNLGYKKNEILKAIKDLDYKNNLNELLKYALKNMLK